MTATSVAHTELLFAYGTLQSEKVQLATFARILVGNTDALTQYQLEALKIDDERVVAVSGKAHHTMARFTGRASDIVPGTVFAMSPTELESADDYEVPAVKRIEVVLESGIRAWTYVDARSAASDS